MFDQEKNSHLMSLSILITCSPNNVWMLEGEVMHESHLEVKGSIALSKFTSLMWEK